MEPSRNSKREAKHNKRQQKLEGSSYTRKEIEQEMRNLEEDKPDHQNQDPNYRRAVKWWKSIDDKFFNTISLQDAIVQSNLTTSPEILGYGSTEATSMLSYQDEFISSFLPSLKDPGKIKVLYKSEIPPNKYCAIAAYGVEEGIASYKSEEEGTNIRIKSVWKKHSVNSENQSTKNPYLNNQSQIKNLRLELEELSENQLLCSRVEKMFQLSNNGAHINEVDQQIQMWEWELQRTNRENNQAWKELIQFIQDRPLQDLKVVKMQEENVDIRRYQDTILWGAILRCFQQGFKDKTQHMLKVYQENELNFSKKPPKGTRPANVKKSFQTDCKICFCSDNSESNQVIYCDHCNTSFHLACYGLTEIPKEDPYYCERCSYVRNQNKKTNKLSCQICSKACFPMKRFGDHFYHVTCLVLFNMVGIREGRMMLQGSLTHRSIMNMVIQNELSHEECEGCRKIGNRCSTLGMKIQCSYKGCNNFFHPICGYLGGCKFNLKKNQGSLQVSLICNAHLASREHQVYLRRYMCNLNDTSAREFNQFHIKFREELDVLEKAKRNSEANKKKYPNYILMWNKYLTNHFKPKQDKQRDKGPVGEGSQIEKMLRELQRRG